MPAKSSTTLTALRQRIAIRPDCIADERTTLLVQQKAAWSHGDFIARKADGTTILTSNGKVLSNSARKEFQDASGLPLFSLPPGGQDVLTVRQKWSLGKIKLDFTLRNAASQDQEEVVLEVRGCDMLNTVSEVSCGGKKVASIQRKMDAEHPMSYKFLPEYDVDVAGAIDTALISVMVIVLAELIQNHWDTRHPRQ